VAFEIREYLALRCIARSLACFRCCASCLRVRGVCASSPRLLLAFSACRPLRAEGCRRDREACVEGREEECLEEEVEEHTSAMHRGGRRASSSRATRCMHSLTTDELRRSSDRTTSTHIRSHTRNIDDRRSNRHDIVRGATAPIFIRTLLLRGGIIGCCSSLFAHVCMVRTLFVRARCPFCMRYMYAHEVASGCASAPWNGPYDSTEHNTNELKTRAYTQYIIASRMVWSVKVCDDVWWSCMSFVVFKGRIAE
jgi:hypothetical protein